MIFVRKGRAVLGSIPYVHPPGPAEITVSGGSFTTELSSTLSNESVSVTGGSFAASLSSSFGADITGGIFSTALSSTLSDTAYYTVTGGTFSTELSSAIEGTELFTVTGGSFVSSLESYGGESVTGGSFASSLSAEINSPTTISVNGGTFVSVASAEIQDIGIFTVTGGRFATAMLSFDVAGGAFNSNLSATITHEVDNAVAYSLNIRTGESTRYTNYPFSHIITIGGRYYGVKSDGLYLLEGDTDIDTEINGMILTKESDHGSPRSKRLQYVYLNSDTATTITPYFDGAEKNSHASAFGGRKTKMSLGNAGRYIQLKIENIDKLYGMEILPADRQQRVK